MIWAGRPLSSRRALIIDRRAVMGTELCRSLTRRGYAVDILGEAVSPAFRSRFCRRRFRVPPLEIGDRFLTMLRERMKDFGYSAVFVCNEEVLESIMQMFSYRHWPGLVLSADATLRTALSKAAMLRIAGDARVPIPRTVFLRHQDDLVEAGKELGMPLIIKGDRGEAGKHVRLVDRFQSLLSAYQEIKALEGTNEVLAQEYVNGTGYSVGGLCHEGRLLRVCAHRKIVGVPPLEGMTVRGVTENCQRLIYEASKIFEALNYTGLGHIELIRTGEDDFRFLEINPRVWGTFGIAEKAGVDFLTPYIELAAGRIPTPDLRFRDNVIFHRIRRELITILRRPSRFPGFIFDCLDPRVHSDFEWLDPLPHLTTLGSQSLRNTLRLSSSNEPSRPTKHGPG